LKQLLSGVRSTLIIYVTFVKDRFDFGSVKKLLEQRLVDLKRKHANAENGWDRRDVAIDIVTEENSKDFWTKKWDPYLSQANIGIIGKTTLESNSKTYKTAKTDKVGDKKYEQVKNEYLEGKMVSYNMFSTPKSIEGLYTSLFGLRNLQESTKLKIDFPEILSIMGEEMLKKMACLERGPDHIWRAASTEERCANGNTLPIHYFIKADGVDAETINMVQKSAEEFNNDLVREYLTNLPKEYDAIEREIDSNGRRLLRQDTSLRDPEHTDGLTKSDRKKFTTRAQSAKKKTGQKKEKGRQSKPYNQGSRHQGKRRDSRSRRTGPKF